MDHVPDNFLVHDLKGTTFRHIIFSTPEQQHLARSSGSFYIDGTFKVLSNGLFLVIQLSFIKICAFQAASKPFTQLLSIHTVIGEGKMIKMVPVYFIFMSSRKKADYINIFKLLRSTHSLDIKKLTGKLNNISYIVKHIFLFLYICFTADFELALWGSITNIYPEVQIHGCLFHFEQAVLRRINVSCFICI